jgi:hypothetical protein
MSFVFVKTNDEKINIDESLVKDFSIALGVVSQYRVEGSYPKNIGGSPQLLVKFPVNFESLQEMILYYIQVIESNTLRLKKRLAKYRSEFKKENENIKPFKSRTTILDEFNNTKDVLIKNNQNINLKNETEYSLWLHNSILTENASENENFVKNNLGFHINTNIGFSFMINKEHYNVFSVSKQTINGKSVYYLYEKTLFKKL